MNHNGFNYRGYFVSHENWLELGIARLMIILFNKLINVQTYKNVCLE